MTDPAKTAAQKVVAAFLTAALTGHTSRQQLAAALRAAADEVVPVDGWVGSHPEAVETYKEIRRELLAIAAELENPQL